MSRTTAPLLSFSASGQIAKTQVYASWKGRPYVRRYVVPANPRTAAQMLTRNAWAWLNDFYRLLPGAVIAAWDAAAISRQITGRNLFLSRNLTLARTATDLVTLEPSTAAGGGVAPGAMVVTPGNDLLTVTLAAPTLPAGWTIVAAHAIAYQAVDPTAVEPSVITYGTDVTDPFSISLTGLASAVSYQVAGWFTYLKPSGATAYSAPALDDGLTT